MLCRTSTSMHLIGRCIAYLCWIIESQPLDHDFDIRPHHHFAHTSSVRVQRVGCTTGICNSNEVGNSPAFRAAMRCAADAMRRCNGDATAQTARRNRRRNRRRNQRRNRADMQVVYICGHTAVKFVFRLRLQKIPPPYTHI